MAFFGITALGPQSVFVAARPDAFDVTLFELKEFAEAFDSEDKGKSGSIPLEKVEAVVKRVFRGEIPGSERGRVLTYFGHLGAPSDPLPKDVFLAGIEHLQREREASPMDMSKTAHYQSYRMMRDHKLREVRVESGPADLYSKPLTLLTEVGWRATEAPVGFERHPKVQCEETKFVGELYKAGVM